MAPADVEAMAAGKIHRIEIKRKKFTGSPGRTGNRMEPKVESPRSKVGKQENG